LNASARNCTLNPSLILTLFKQRRVDHEHDRAAQRTATHFPESPLGRQHEGSRIEPLIGLPDDDLPLKVGIPAKSVGITVVAGTGNIGASQRREGESPRNPDAPIPLPAANQRDWFAFLLDGFIKRRRASVYPVERVLLGEIRGKHDQLYVLDATKYFTCLAKGRPV